MHIARSMPLQQHNHEKLQVFHGDTKFKMHKIVQWMFMHLPNLESFKA